MSFQPSEEETRNLWDVGPQGALDCIEAPLPCERPWCLFIWYSRQQKPGLGTAPGTAPRDTQDEEDNEVSAKNENLSPRFLRPVWAEKALGCSASDSWLGDSSVEFLNIV